MILMNLFYDFIIILINLFYNFLIGPNHGESLRHSYSTLDARTWKRREQRIIDHLLLLRPTIICL